MRFWETTPLSQMTGAQWESLCDGCGKCCLHKIIDADTEELSYTNVGCRLLDSVTCRCRSYTDRVEHVPDCVSLTPTKLEEIDWMPSTCAYRLLHEGKPLPDWHPLVSGRPETVHESGNSVQYRIISEDKAGPLLHHVVDWWD